MELSAFERIGNVYIDENGKAIYYASEDDIRIYDEMKARQRKLLDDKKKGIRKGDEFFNVSNNEDSYDVLIDNFSTKEIGTIMQILMKFEIRYNGKLYKYRNRKNMPVTEDEFRKVLGYGTKSNERKKYCLFKKKLVEFDIVRFGETVEINPAFFWKGSIPKEMLNVSSIKPLKIRNHGLTKDQLGIIYKMQKFIHKDDLYLCHNPEGKTIEEARPITNIEDLCKVVGVSRNTLFKHFINLKLDNQSGIVAKIQVCNITRFFINPDLVFKGSQFLAEEKVSNQIGYDNFVNIFRLK